ncbi:hypothetical protein [Streptomyces specialis]|uniref:hypothetical protein n=1 Tax=Streptomyces specialis TaxID=498367 RepID=UPI00131CBD69|nr:hypothetical protein [Streptomyces specialis]
MERPVRLPAGTTGLAPRDDPALPEVGAGPFRSACHAVTRATGMRSVAFPPPDPCTNYRTALLSSYDESVAVLGHHHYPWVAFARADEEVNHSPGFLPPPSWAEHFVWAGFEPLSAEFLSTPTADADLSELLPYEKAQVKVWKPGTIGAIVFNWWG